MKNDPQTNPTVKNKGLRVCVLGPGFRFLSGISYYTLRLANALAGSHRVSVILMRQLLPTYFYPGRQRVGVPLTRLEYAASIEVFDGVNWYWIPSILNALVFLIRQRPEIILCQWWTGTVIHSYLVLALVARLLGAKVIVELHEIQDTGEARIRLAHAYVEAVRPLLMRLASGFLVHSDYDLQILKTKSGFKDQVISIIPLGPFDHGCSLRTDQRNRVTAGSCCNLLFFGVIRPFKGLEDLITAFDLIPEDQISNYSLTVVGETWEGWTIPEKLIAESRYKNRITFENRYVTDEELAEFLAAADAVVLPYHRSSASGPLHTAMSWGLPVVVTRVGGLPEAVAGYEGAILIPPKDPDALRKALGEVIKLRGKRFTDPQSWERTVTLYNALFDSLRGDRFAMKDKQAYQPRREQL